MIKINKKVLKYTNLSILKIKLEKFKINIFKY